MQALLGLDPGFEILAVVGPMPETQSLKLLSLPSVNVTS